MKKNEKKIVTHRAGWVVSDSSKIFENGYVKIENGIIKEIGKFHKTNLDNTIDHGGGIILPALVNTHTHLELTGLKQKITFEKGFTAWVKNLISLRETIRDEDLALSAVDGVNELIKSGCYIIADISSLEETWNIISSSNLYGISFREFIGNFLPEKIRCNLKSRNMISSVAGHAPHTTSPKTITTLKKLSKKYSLPFSIHLAESYDEVNFFLTEKGSWADLLNDRGIDFSLWELSGRSPVEHLEHIGVLDKNTLAVHLLYPEKKDFKILASNGVNVCICPRSNFNLHKKLPEIEKMIKAKIKLSIGTDSLASVDSLNIFEETAYIAHAFPNIPAKIIFNMATINGAAALGLNSKLGTLSPGKYGAAIYAPLTTSKKANIIEALVNFSFDDYVYGL